VNAAPQLIRRIQRHRVKVTARPQLNLVALMDVFTLLVFFFLVHSPDVAESANTHLISLPESVAELAPRQTVVITVTKDMLMLRDEPVASVESALNSPQNAIVPLGAALQNIREAGGAGSPDLGTSAYEVTIMGDKSIPFRLLKKVMITCTQAGFGRISLAVLQKPGQSG
jgi:biopolymer transport protein ExbD